MKLTLAKTLNSLNLICLCGATLDLAVRYGSLPDRLVVRYALDGSPGEPGRKSVLLVLVLMMWALTAFMLFLELLPKLLLMRQGSGTEETGIGRVVGQTLSSIKLAVTVLLWWMLHCSLLQRPLGRAYLFLFLIAVTLPLLLMLVRILRAGLV